MRPLFPEVYTSGLTLSPTDSKPEFIIKFEQEMLQGKSIMQMPRKKGKEMNTGEYHPAFTHLEDHWCLKFKPPGV